MPVTNLHFKYTFEVTHETIVLHAHVHTKTKDKANVDNERGKAECKLL